MSNSKPDKAKIRFVPAHWAVCSKHGFETVKTKEKALKDAKKYDEEQRKKFEEERSEETIENDKNREAVIEIKEMIDRKKRELKKIRISKHADEDYKDKALSKREDLKDEISHLEWVASGGRYGKEED